jgi:hypothetical protein
VRSSNPSSGERREGEGKKGKEEGERERGREEEKERVNGLLISDNNSSKGPKVHLKISYLNLYLFLNEDSILLNTNLVPENALYILL